MRSAERSKKLGQWLIGLGFFIFLIFPLSELKAENPSLDSIALQIRTPEALQKFMSKNFTYVEDRILFHQDEYWQTPEEMLERKEGDCEDYALFVQAILSRNGYRVLIMSAYGKDDAHTVAIFEKDGTLGIFDLDELRFLKYNSIKEIGEKIQLDWSYLALMRTEGNSGIISQKFQSEKALKASIPLPL